MKGTLHVLDTASGKRAASLSWDGSMSRGKGKWTYSDPKYKTKVQNAISANDDLSSVRFSDLVHQGGGDRVRGWQGFAGQFQALSMALPAFGLAVDLDTIEWPH